MFCIKWQRFNHFILNILHTNSFQFQGLVCVAMAETERARNTAERCQSVIVSIQTYK